MFQAASAISFALLVLIFFALILSIVAMVKILQIAEDIRHKRHIEEGGVRAPRPYWIPVVVCLIFAFLIVILIGVYGGASLPGILPR